MNDTTLKQIRTPEPLVPSTALSIGEFTFAPEHQKEGTGSFLLACCSMSQAWSFPASQDRALFRPEPNAPTFGLSMRLPDRLRPVVSGTGSGCSLCRGGRPD